MTHLTPAHSRTIVVVDVAKFSDSEWQEIDQFAVRQGMYEVLKTAFSESDIDFDSCEREDRGDGALILVPPNISRSTIADRLPDRLVAALRRYNSTRVPKAQFKLRVALHSGDIRHDGNGWVGPAVNLAFRILEAPEAKAALRESGRMVALNASDHFFTEVIQHDPGTVPEDYRQITVSEKNFTGWAWLRPLGHDVRALPLTRPRSPRPVAELVPTEDMDTLRNLLTVREVPHLASIMSRVAGTVIPVPGHDEVRNAWDAFQYFTEFNAGPDGLPPAVLFLEHVADEVGGEFGETLMSWVDVQARHLRLTSALSRFRHSMDAADAAPDISDAAGGQSLGTLTKVDATPLSTARIRLRSDDTVRVGEPVEVDFAFVRSARPAGPQAELSGSRVPLRILLHATDASVRPMTRMVDLKSDRTSREVRFEVIPNRKGRLSLVFRVYLARDGQLLQEVRANLVVRAT